MSKLTQSGPGDGDPNTFNADESSQPWTPPSQTTPPDAGQADEVTYKWVKCYTSGLNKNFVGYLSTRGFEHVAIGDGADYPKAECYWWEGKEGDDYLGKRTSPKDRWLGYGTGWYAGWALGQARNMGYYTNVIYNPDHTISPGTYPRRYLAGPYESGGINWCWWAPAGESTILVCELVQMET